MLTDSKHHGKFPIDCSVRKAICKLYQSAKMIYFIIIFQAIMAMVPEAWQTDNIMTKERKNFYLWSSCTMEAWDGPGEPT